MGSYVGTDEKVQTFAEHLLPPVLTYVVRKLNLAVVLGLVFVARQGSRPYGFDFEADVGDRSEWKWLSDWSLPRWSVVRKEK